MKQFRSSILLTVAFMLFIAASSFSQTEKKELSDKLDKIKGDVTKITIENSDGHVSFTGEEASFLFKKLKRSDKMKSVQFFGNHGGDKNVFMIKKDQAVSDFVWHSSDDENGKKIEKKLDLVVEDGIQKLTVTITEDGKENVETFEGDEVDQYFERDGVHRFKVKDGDKKHMLMFLSEDGNEFEFGGEKNIDVKVEVSDKGGEKKVTVTKTVDGKVVVEEYVGEKADEFMEKHDNKKFNVKVKKIGHHNGSLIVVDEDNLDLDIDIDCDDDEMIWVTSGDTNKIMKKKLVKVTEEDGVKKVTVTTTENGEKKVETYEGEKAEQFLKELEEKDSADGDSGKKIKKKIIKKIK